MLDGLDCDGHGLSLRFCLCGGNVIRYNIVHAEPVLTAKPSEATSSFERASDFALVVAYAISLCLYLHILSSFVLRMHPAPS